MGSDPRGLLIMAMFPSTCPQPGDDENVLLGKIAQSLCGGSGGGVTSLSINGGAPLTGALSLTIPDGDLFLLKSGDTGTGPFLFAPLAANTTPLTLSNALNGASTAPALAINTTWNTTGAPMALLLNVTNTASAAAAQLFDFQLGGVSVLNLRRDGRLTLAGRIAATTTSSIGHGLRISDASTAGASVALTIGHNLSAGVGAVGMGVIFDQTLDSSTTADTRATRWSTAWTDATHATRTAATTFNAFQAGVETTQMVLTNSQIQSNVGTVALPAFTNRNDVDTGVYFPAADQVGVSVGGALVLTAASTAVIFNVPARLKSYTVATLPAGTQGDTAFVTDATAPVFLAAAVGGGAVVSSVFFNGATWVTA